MMWSFGTLIELAMHDIIAGNIKELMLLLILFIDKPDSQATQENEKFFSPQPTDIMCSWNEFKQIVNLREIKDLNDLRWSMQKIGDWQSLCKNLHLDTANMNRIKNERSIEYEKKDECLQSYFNSDEGSWEEVVMAVASPPFNNKRLAKKIAEKHLVSPNKDTILAMIKTCDTYY